MLDLNRAYIGRAPPVVGIIAVSIGPELHIVIAVIVVVLVVIGFVLLLIYAPQVLVVIKKWIDAEKEKKRKAKDAVNSKVLDKITEGAVAA